MKEAKTLSDIGCREVILLGQNVNAYHGVNKDNIQISLAKVSNGTGENRENRSYKLYNITS